MCTCSLLSLFCLSAQSCLDYSLVALNFIASMFHHVSSSINLVTKLKNCSFQKCFEVRVLWLFVYHCVCHHRALDNQVYAAGVSVARDKANSTLVSPWWWCDANEVFMVCMWLTHTHVTLHWCLHGLCVCMSGGVVCVCVCVCVCMFACMCACMCICVCRLIVAVVIKLAPKSPIWHFKLSPKPVCCLFFRFLWHQIRDTVNT